MSFSGKIKEELAQHYAKARHCNLAELSALVHMSGSFEKDGYGSCILKLHTENDGVARKCFTLLGKTFNISTDMRFAGIQPKEAAVIISAPREKNFWRWRMLLYRPYAASAHISAAHSLHPAP